MTNTLRHNLRATWWALRNNPGVTFQIIADKMGCALQTTRRNMRELTRIGMAVQEGRIGKVYLFFAICDGSEIEYAEFIKRSDDAKGGGRKTKSVSVGRTRYTFGDQIHGDRGRAQGSFQRPIRGCSLGL